VLLLLLLLLLVMMTSNDEEGRTVDKCWPRLQKIRMRREKCGGVTCDV
jgi:hypothetical protein